MIQIKFKNLEKSELVSAATEDRLNTLIGKFPDLSHGKMRVTLEMENSPTQAGPDFFKVKVFVSSGRYRGMTVEKSNSNLYVALAEVVDHMLEALNRFGDRARVMERKMARKITSGADQNFETTEPKSG